METASAAGIIVVFCTVIVGLGLFWRYVWFFRNPPRDIPPGECIVSPADGTVVYVKIVQPGEKVIAIKEGVEARIEDIVKEDICCRKLLIGIFMSPFDVHVNRVPATGVVTRRDHRPGKFHVASHAEASSENERMELRIETSQGFPLGLVQIAGRMARRIVCYPREGDPVQRGKRFGMIRFGSRVEMFLPEEVSVSVHPGQRVKGGETVMGYFP